MDWIQFIREDENKALTQIYSLYRNECLQWLKQHYALNEEDCAEVFQLAVIILYDNVMTKKLTTLSSQLKSYLFAIAKNQALKIGQKKQNMTNIDIHDNVIGYVMEDNDHGVTETQLIKANLSLEILGDPCKSLLQLYYYKNMGMEDITELLGYKNADTTKNQKYKCLKRLQKIYHEYKDKRLENERV